MLDEELPELSPEVEPVTAEAVDFGPPVAASALIVRERDCDDEFPLHSMRHYGICRRRGAPALPYPDTLETIGDHLTTRRLDLGLYQKDVAKQLGVTTCTVTNWEENHSSPQLYLIPRVIAFLGYDPVSGDSDH